MKVSAQDIIGDELKGTYTSVDDAILDAMARAFFVTAWADYEEENDRHYPGTDLMDVAPETGQEAKDAASTLYADIESVNGVKLDEFVPPGLDADEWDWDVREEFGHYLAMEAMGHGVGWSDDWPDHGLEVPYTEFSWFNLDPDLYPSMPEEDELPAEDTPLRTTVNPFRKDKIIDKLKT